MTETSVNSSDTSAAPAVAAPAANTAPDALLSATKSAATAETAVSASSKIDAAPDVKPNESTPKETTPVEIKYELKAPEGYDAKDLEAFAREHKLAPEVAQKVLDRDVARKEADGKAMAESLKNIAEKGWIEEIKNDKVLGGDKFMESKTTANRAWDTVPDAIKTELTKAGLQNNPAVFKILHHFGGTMKEDSFVKVGTQSSDSISSPGKFYSKK